MKLQARIDPGSHSLQISGPSLECPPSMETRWLLAAPEPHLICPAISESLRLDSRTLLPEEGGPGLRQAKRRGGGPYKGPVLVAIPAPSPSRTGARLPFLSILLVGLRISCLPPSRSPCPCVPRTASLGKGRSPWVFIPAASSVSTAFWAPSSTKLQMGLTDPHPCPALPCPALGLSGPFIFGRVSGVSSRGHRCPKARDHV